MSAIGPRALPTKFTCDGCPALRTEEWSDCLDNDETDCGTSGRCAAADGKSITAYWNKLCPPPSWCPATPPAQPSGSEGSVVAAYWRAMYDYALTLIDAADEDEEGGIAGVAFSAQAPMHLIEGKSPSEIAAMLCEDAIGAAPETAVVVPDSAAPQPTTKKG